MATHLQGLLQVKVLFTWPAAQHLPDRRPTLFLRDVIPWDSRYPMHVRHTIQKHTDVVIGRAFCVAFVSTSFLVCSHFAQCPSPRNGNPCCAGIRGKGEWICVACLSKNFISARDSDPQDQTAAVQQPEKGHRAGVLRQGARRSPRQRCLSLSRQTSRNPRSPNPAFPPPALAQQIWQPSASDHGPPRSSSTAPRHPRLPAAQPSLTGTQKASALLTQADTHTTRGRSMTPSRASGTRRQ